MRGAQALVLANRDSGDYASQSLADFSHEVASAFTRYIYPESFGWRQADDEVVFFNRANRPPPWMTGVINATRASVVIARNPPIARALLNRIRRENRLSYAHFDTELAGVPYELSRGCKQRRRLSRAAREHRRIHCQSRMSTRAVFL